MRFDRTTILATIGVLIAIIVVALLALTLGEGRLLGAALNPYSLCQYAPQGCPIGNSYPVCYDSDGGLNPADKGLASILYKQLFSNGRVYTVSVGAEVDDSCVTPTRVQEAFCDNDTTVRSAEVVCELGCFDGACITPTPEPSGPPAFVCEDTDEANSLSEKGEVTYLKYTQGGETVETDRCFDAQSLLQVSCGVSRENPTTLSFTSCPEGTQCQNGACLGATDAQEFLGCSDTDPNDNPLATGTTTLSARNGATLDEATDVCADTSTLTQYSCSADGTITSATTDCGQDACAQGACVRIGDVRCTGIRFGTAGDSRGLRTIRNNQVALARVGGFYTAIPQYSGALNSSAVAVKEASGPVAPQQSEGKWSFPERGTYHLEWQYSYTLDNGEQAYQGPTCALDVVVTDSFIGSSPTEKAADLCLVGETLCDKTPSLPFCSTIQEQCS